MSKLKPVTPFQSFSAGVFATLALIITISVAVHYENSDFLLLGLVNYLAGAFTENFRLRNKT